MTRKKKLLLGCGSLFVLCLLAFIGWRTYQYIYRNHYYVSPKISLKEIELAGEHQEFVSFKSRNRVYVGESYLAVAEWKIRDNREDSYQIHEDEYFNVYVYDLRKEDFPRKKLDIYQAVQNYAPDYDVDTTYDLVYYEGQDYLYLTLQRPDSQSQKLVRKPVLLNLDTETISQAPDGVDFIPTVFQAADSKTALYKILNENYGVSEGYNFLGVNSNESGNITGVNLNILYPDFVNLLNRKGRDSGIIFARQGQVSEAEWFDTLLHWFAPEGEESLALTVTDDSTGETATVRSYQEYADWKAAHPDA